jgi:glycosyltransferase involved in cell wall biosynthesis
MTSSVLIPSFRRPEALRRCLQSLARQTCRADEVFVVWQADDTPTRDAAEAARSELGDALHVIHCPTAGVVPAENTALAASSGEVVFLIDDDAVAPPDWLQRHLAHYADPRVGAVGGPADNIRPDGSAFPVHPSEPVGRLTWYGRLIGNAYDQPAAWRNRPPADVDHLVGYNMSLRRAAFDHFAEALRPYWQMFEADACLQASRKGFRIVFDFANVVEHHPVNTVYQGGRHGDLRTKVYNAAYNHGFIMATRMPPWRWPFILAYGMAVGNVSSPGLAAALVAVRRHGHPLREAGILLRTIASNLAGWRDGVRRRYEP